MGGRKEGRKEGRRERMEETMKGGKKEGKRTTAKREGGEKGVKTDRTEEDIGMEGRQQR